MSKSREAFVGSLGFVEDIDILYVKPAILSLRLSINNIEELANSISKVGLLQPIVVRSLDSSFEIVAGNRRYFACKSLGFKKISAHIVDLDDKSAFEISLIENVQRNTLDPVEEALAFKKYVGEMGWGGTSDLAKKLSKSPSYISRRIKLLELPTDVLDLISQSEICVSAAEELLAIKDRDKTAKFAAMVRDNGISSRKVLESIRELDEISELNPNKIPDMETISKLFDRSIIALRFALFKLGMILEKIQDNWIFYDILMQHKHMLHAQIDMLIKQKRKCKKKWNMIPS